MTQEYLKNNPPKYENIKDETSLEHGVYTELEEAWDELVGLSQEVKRLNDSFVDRMKQKNLTWGQVAEELEAIRDRIEQVSDFVLEKFD